MFQDYFSGFEAAHIFPRAYENEWLRHDHRRWVARNPVELAGTDSFIDSPRNGFLLSAIMHQQWDSYEVAVNPDVCCFFHARCERHY